MPIRQATLEETENVATAIRSRLKSSPVYLSTLNEIIKGCRKLKEDSCPAIVDELTHKISSFQAIAQELHAKREFDDQTYDILRVYCTILKEAAKN